MYRNTLNTAASTQKVQNYEISAHDFYCMHTIEKKKVKPMNMHGARYTGMYTHTYVHLT